ncbi:MAG: hypothetical protein R3E76_10190 [Planctomycetota bacterium]
MNTEDDSVLTAGHAADGHIKRNPVHEKPLWTEPRQPDSNVVHDTYISTAQSSLVEYLPDFRSSPWIQPDLEIANDEFPKGGLLSEDAPARPEYFEETPKGDLEELESVAKESRNRVLACGDESKDFVSHRGQAIRIDVRRIGRRRRDGIGRMNSDEVREFEKAVGGDLHTLERAVVESGIWEGIDPRKQAEDWSGSISRGEFPNDLAAELAKALGFPSNLFGLPSQREQLVSVLLQALLKKSEKEICESSPGKIAIGMGVVSCIPDVCEDPTIRCMKGCRALGITLTGARRFAGVKVLSEELARDPNTNERYREIKYEWNMYTMLFFDLYVRISCDCAEPEVV